MKRENLFTHVNTIKKTKSSELQYNKYREDIANEEKTLPLIQEVWSS